MAEEKPYEGWGIVELFGHQQIAGMLSEQSIGGTAFLRVDVPELDGTQAFTKFFGGGAIYAITPTDEATARIAVASIQARPVNVWMVPDRRPALPEPRPATFLDGYEDYEEEDR